jgi:Uma2 family endonuclease
MTGGTDAHEAIGGALRAILHERLRGGPWRARGPTMKIEAAGRIRYPDAFVYCGAVERRETVIRDPVVVFEVLSAGTSRTDRIEKLREYQATPSIQRYVILEQESAAATMFVRRGDDWIARALTDVDTIDMPEIGIAVSLAEIYAETGAGLMEDAAAFDAG